MAPFHYIVWLKMVSVHYLLKKDLYIWFIFYTQVYNYKMQVRFEFGYNPPIIVGGFSFIFTALEFHIRSITWLPFEFFMIHHSYVRQKSAIYIKKDNSHIYNSWVNTPLLLLCSVSCPKCVILFWSTPLCWCYYEGSSSPIFTVLSSALYSLLHRKIFTPPPQYKLQTVRIPTTKPYINVPYDKTHPMTPTGVHKRHYISKPVQMPTPKPYILVYWCSLW